jgi:hypothetical protein
MEGRATDDQGRRRGLHTSIPEGQTPATGALELSSRRSAPRIERCKGQKAPSVLELPQLPGRTRSANSVASLTSHFTPSGQ